ncbi:MAG: hypothetical protein K5905_30535, partial [Roseibium sp.]|nr:hypothetical protein [Roseibium sp.]
NDVDNKVENSVENKVETEVETKVETDIEVDITVDLDLSTLPDDSDVIDVEEMGIDHIHEAVAQVDAVAQSAGNGGANFNLDQINNMTDNDFQGYAKVEFEGGNAGMGFVGDIGIGNDDLGGGFIQAAAAHGGTATANGATARVGDDGSNEGVGSASADGAVNQEAFTQSIVQYNSASIVGGDSTTSDDGDAV